MEQGVELVLSVADETAILEGAHGILNELAQMELMLKTAGQQDEELIEELSQLRKHLREDIHSAFQVHRSKLSSQRHRVPAPWLKASNRGPRS